MAMLPDHADLEVLGDRLKNGGKTDCCSQQFSSRFHNGHSMYQNVPFKRRKQMGKLWRLDSNGLDTVQRNELIIPGQNHIRVPATEKWGIYSGPWSS